MKVIIYSRSDVMLILRRGIYPSAHRHHAIQITVTAGDTFEAVIDKQRAKHRALIIDSDYLHHVVGREDWVFTLLLNPETALAKTIQRRWLQTTPYKSLDVQLDPSMLAMILSETFTCQRLDPLLARVSDLLLPQGIDITPPDARIEQVLEIVQHTEDRKIGAGELSRQVYLSESRLGHLFKEEVGIPLRRYLLWCRLILAARVIAQGENYTFAAHETGFTDSAHLSRTFYAMFGLRISDMFGDRNLIRVSYCDE